MLRLLIVLIVFLVILTSLGESANTSTSLRRITNTPEHILNLNPVISGDGEHVVFESTFDFLGLGGGPAFRTFDASRTEPISQIAISRAVSPAISQDGSAIVFASTEDPLGTNADRNSELFLSVHASGNRTLRQLTNTAPDASTDRLTDGCFDPSITDEGRFVVFSSNRNLNGLNSGNHSEIFLVDTTTNVLRNLTPNANQQSTEPKIAGNASVVAYIQSDALSEGRSLIVLDVSSGASRVVVTGNDLKLTRGKAISDQGTRIVYSALVAEDQTQVFLYDSVANTTRQLTELPPRADDVPLNPAISGDGKRITFATRRNVIGGNSDRSVELYLLDLPTAKIAKLTNAPSSASAEVLSSLNDDGSIAAFNFPRVLSGPTSETDFSNNSEIYTLALESRPAFGDLEVLNGASLNHNPQTDHVLAKGSIATARGDALSYATSQAQLASDGSLPRRLNGTKVTVQGTAAQILFVSPTQVNFIIPPQAHNGPAEVTVENLDGFISKTTITIADSAPGVFTLTGDGLGEACVLNAENLLGGPFDPTNGRSRLILFATGVRNTSDVNVIIDGKPSEVESVHPSDDLAGLDEVRVLVPSQLRGAGIVDLSINAGGQTSNLVSLAFSGSSLRDIMINEFLADPPDGIFGDANHDGTRSASDDEFVELVNSTERDLDLSAYVVLTRTANGVDVVRHRFAPQTVIPAGTALVVFGGGNPSSSNPVFAGAQILEASSGSLSLLNSSGRITIIDASGEVITSLSYGGSTGLRADENQSLVRVPDISGDLVQHATVGLMRFSPGARINGGPFLPSPAIAQIQVSPASASVDVGQELQFAASAFDHTGMLLRDVIFNWSSSNESVARIDRHGLLTALRAGAVGITASARGTSSTSSSLLVREPSPSPSPTPTPSPSPTVSPSPSPTPNPSPSVTPSPSPSPTTVPNIVISEFRTRGPNGASDEFVEIYNNSESTIDVSGWKIRTSSNAGSISTRLTISNGTLLPARHHLLFANASAYSGTVHPDQTFATGMANDGGIGLTLPSDVIVDQVGMSSGSAYKEGTNLAPLPSDANQSYERRPGGTAGSTQDSNDNFADFQLRTPSDPQNLNSPPVPNPSPSPSPTPSVSPEPSPSPSPTATPTPTPPPSPALVLSEIYGGGGNAGAAFRNDFIEIFNAGSVAVSLIGWSVQYSSATGTSWTVTNLTSITLAPGQFYLVQEASGGANGAVLPATDVAGMIAMAATAGKVALVNSTAPLTGACPVSPSIVDFVGYGTQANCFRGTGPSTPPGNSTSISRNNQGCSNTGNNNTDFSSGTPSPRNTSSPSNTCSSSLMLELTRMLTRDRTLKM